MTYYSGFNGFEQFDCGSAEEAHTLKSNTFREFNSEYKGHDKGLCSFSWAFNVFAADKELTITGFIDGQVNGKKKFITECRIVKICSNDNICLILLENGDLYNLNVRQSVMFKLNFIDIEKSYKRNIFGELKDETVIDYVEHIACGNSICVAITKRNVVYNIPSKIYQFQTHERIKMVSCGFEHAIALNYNGDVYTWGNGLRGQLGHEDLKEQEYPVLLDALAGIKIIAVAAGGWHSGAISAFRDIYLWGSNVNGQIGIKVFKTVNIGDKQVESRLKNPTVYPLPQIVDLLECCRSGEDNLESPCEPAKLICGARHTFIQNSCGKVFCCGWNEHGQLGIKDAENVVDNFVENKNLPKIPEKIFCGPWCTVIK